jgi:sec-independent protein translocase protein TatA
MGLSNPIHIAFLLVLLLLVFGAKRLPEMGRSLGSGMRGFRDALTGEDAHPSREHQPSLDAPQPQVAPVAHAVPAVQVPAVQVAPVAHIAPEPIQAGSPAA